MSGYEVAAFVQLLTAVAFFALGAVGFWLRRLTLGLLGGFAATFFLRLSIPTYRRGNPDFDIIEWAAQPFIIILHTGGILLLLVGVIVELVIREGNRGRVYDP